MLSDRERAMERHPDDFETEDGCYECGGEGFIVADCFEDSCCCADPEMDHGLIPCPLCKPVEQRRGSGH